nr:hypothetical protein [Tanacetum cinerariifolium]
MENKVAGSDWNLTPPEGAVGEDAQ